MSIEKPEVHRPGPLKQTNKQHKTGRHRSKGSINSTAKGKISLKTLTKKNKRELNREERRNQSLQLRQKKREEIWSKKRLLGGFENAPFLVCILPLTRHFDPETILNLFTQCDSEALVKKSPTGVTHICSTRFKQKFAFVIPKTNNEFDVLDTLKISDTVLFLISAATGMEDHELIDKWGENLLLSTFSQGLPTPIVAVTDLESIAPKRRNDHKQYIQKLVNKWLPEEKIITLGTEAEALNAIRKIGSQKKKPVFYRDKRAHLYADQVEYLPDQQGSSGTLKVTGYVRGAALTVNGLVHIPGLGDFQMSQIDAIYDPYVPDREQNSTVKILEVANPTKQESLDSENVPDPMDAEQTWPTTEELAAAAKESKKKVKKIPKGWSDYQAAWIPDDDAEFQSDSDSEKSEEDDAMQGVSEEHSEEGDEDFQTITESEIAVNDERYDEEMDLQEEQKDLEQIKAAKLDSAFPDEMDTPVDQAARVRFQRYRGLESFRTSPWDPKENLPADYARIFQFQNFHRTKKRIFKEQEDMPGVWPGIYVTIHVKDVSQLMWQSFKTAESPVVLIGLLPHEHRMSVQNVLLKRTSNYDLPIKSKDRLIFQCGYRRFAVNPIFSEHTNGQKHKFERFFQPDSTTVATFYAPIQFPPSPVLCFKEVNNELILVATGSLLSCNPDRIVLKRIVLSGHPFRIHKKSAVIRFMFFNREDIIYFKPCKLRTKMGKIGHIKEPLGTHGHMKCVFDGQLKSQDTVLLNLYKRIFPKWTYEDLTVNLNVEMS